MRSFPRERFAPEQLFPSVCFPSCSLSRRRPGVFHPWFAADRGRRSPTFARRFTERGSPPAFRTLLSKATPGTLHPESRRPPAAAVSVQVFSLSASLFVKSRFARLALGRFTRAHGLPLCAVESFSVARLAGFTFFMRLDHASARRSTARGSSRRAPCSAPTSPGPWSGAAASLPGATSDAIRATLGPSSSAAIPRAIPSTNCRDARPHASNHGSSSPCSEARLR